MFFTQNRWRGWVLILLLCASVGASRCLGATPAQIDESIRKAKEFLYSKQVGDNWEFKPNYHVGGATSLVVYALLTSGESPLDPRIQKAIEYLKRTDMDDTYGLGMRMQVWLFLKKTPDVQDAIRRDAKKLLEGMGTSGIDRGFYGYTVKKGPQDYHHSTSQYGVLGVWAADQAGLELPQTYWETVEKAWRGTQTPEGGWAYRFHQPVDPKKNPASASMTAAGIATLFITNDFLHSNDGLKCKGNVINSQIELGLKWMTDKISTASALDCYTLYGLERIGVASGYKYFGTIDWFAKFADRLVQKQSKEGSWGDWGEIPGTAFGLVFLTRGRAPVVMNKLIYDEPDAKNSAQRVPANWNQRPRDAANVAKWIGKQIERDLNFQVVNLNVDVSDLHDSPILYLSGNSSINLLPEQEAKLKEFVEQGGLILGNADCAAEGFAKSFKELGGRLFPAYEFRELPDSHPIYTNQMFVRNKWKSTFSVSALTNGVRELMVLIPSADAGKAWQINDNRSRVEMFQFMADLFLYAVDKKNLRFKGQTYVVNRSPTTKTSQTIKLARIEYDGNWDPEPGGWRRQSNVMINERGIKLEVGSVKLGSGKLKDYQVAHLTGTTKLSLTVSAKDELAAWIKGGGRLIVDSAGGSQDFAASAEAELASLLPECASDLNQSADEDSPIYGSRDQKVTEIALRECARRTLGNVGRPQLRCMKIKGEPAVIYSREDLSAGLVGQSVDGIIGYEPSSATRLMTNILASSVEKRQAKWGRQKSE